MEVDKQIHQWLEIGRKLLKDISQLTPEITEEVQSLLQTLYEKSNDAPRLYLIVNEGVHPIMEDLKQQFGENIEYEVVTRGNVTLEEEAQVARRVKEILEKH
ncbi:MAG: hypothetical protein D6813_10055, partial [Calditrichaeota bacterium]